MLFSIDNGFVYQFYQYITSYFLEFANEFSGMYEIVSASELFPLCFFLSMLVMIAFSVFTLLLIYKFICFLFNLFVR